MKHSHIIVFSAIDMVFTAIYYRASVIPVSILKQAIYGAIFKALLF